MADFGRIEELRVASEVNFQRQRLKLMVYKAVAAFGLTILICGGCLGVLYALGS
jgi:hypothetical protein